MTQLVEIRRQCPACRHAVIDSVDLRTRIVNCHQCGHEWRTNLSKRERPFKKSRPEKKKIAKQAARRVRNSQSRSRADMVASGLHWSETRPEALQNRGGSGFYNPSHSIAQSIQDALNPDQEFSELGEIVFDKGRQIEKEKENTDDEKMAMSYRVVHRRTDRAVLLGMNGRKVWLPLAKIEFVEGNLVRIPRWIVRQKGLIFRDRPVEI